MVIEYEPTPLTDFSKPENKKAMEDALAKARAEFGKQYPLEIRGKKIMTEKRIKSVDPCYYATVVGEVARCDADLANQAIEHAYEVYVKLWSKVCPEARARVIWKAAEIARRRRLELAALMVYEIGKSWIEADADVAEAIDFMEYYARLMYQLAQPIQLTRLPNEDNEQYYIPLGVAVVIPPWNFPFAILVGMATAAIVTGNAVVLKPASDTPVIGYKLVEIMEEAGLPPGVLNFIPGSGSEIGDLIVDHPLTRIISLTGSKEVGLRIIERAAITHPGQKWIKRVVAEMGGKDSIIVDSSADLQEAANSIISSAFGFQGQKCSACSRAIVVEDVYDAIIDLLLERVARITMGHTENPANYMGAVSSAGAFEKIKKYIEIGKTEGKLIFGGESDGSKGWFIKPTVIKDVNPMARISLEEIFGPVLAVIKAKNFDDALNIANNTEYGLTGSVYARDCANIEKARWEFHVGNLYFNRKCTGALVGVHPFGGFNMSGTDSKAGGPDYLLLYLQAKVVSEKF